MTSPLTPEERAEVRRQFADESIVRLLDERDSLERRALQAERERDEARAALSKSEYWLRTVRETREEEQAERRAQREREAAALARAREFDACSERHLSARQAAEARLEQAREAMNAWLKPAPHPQAPLEEYEAWADAEEAALAALRAALEPGAGS